MARYEVDGYFSRSTCENIKQKFEGKTFMNFHIEYGGFAGNYTITVTSDIEENDKELAEMFIHYVLANL